MLLKKRIMMTLLALMLTLTMLPASTFALPEYTYDGETGRTTETLYDGVSCTHISLGEDSKYKKQEFWVVEFDPRQEGLSVDVTMGAEYANQLRTVQDTVEHFNETNGENKVAISAINGDLWMVAYAHARVEGSGTSYNGYDDAVVTKSLTLPRGLNIYNGEIITSAHTSFETPYEGAFDCFGITDDGESILGTPTLVINSQNITQNAAIKVNGLNRLPANNALMLYSDKGCPENYSLSDAYEIVIDCDEDYKVTQNSTIRGKVTAICKEGDENAKMQPNRFILCARGTAVGRVEGINIGDEIEFSFSLKVPKKDQEIWDRVTNAVGGHMKLVVDGKVQGLNDTNAYPTSIIGNTKDGKIVFITMDGRQADTGYSVGFQIRQMGEVLVEMGVENAFLLDGGGSATMVNINEEGGYDLVNRPCDRDENGNFGKARTVVNTIILSYTKPAETDAPADETPTGENPSGTAKKGCGSIALGSLSAAVLMLFGTTLCLTDEKRAKKAARKGK